MLFRSSVAKNTPPQKHDHVDWELGEQILRFHDPRRFGSVLWHDAADGDWRTHPRLQSLGMEPFDPAFDGEHIYRATRSLTQDIKVALMSGKWVVGVGNIYANESLFYAGIHPERESRQLSRADCDRLASEIKRVLARAIEAGGSSLRDFTDAKGKPGYFQQSYKVYGRAGLPCHDCGALIAELRQGQRSSCYCPHCQPL